MRSVDRAKQFLPFDALKGFKEALRQKEMVHDRKKELLDDYLLNLDATMRKLKRGSLIKLKYYKNLQYVDAVGEVKWIDSIYKKIVLSNNETINFDNIDYIEVVY